MSGKLNYLNKYPGNQKAQKLDKGLIRLLKDLDIGSDLDLPIIAISLITILKAHVDNIQSMKIIDGKTAQEFAKEMVIEIFNEIMAA